MKTILWGICGIGSGHCNRQLPLIKHYISKGFKIIILTYGQGLVFFKNKFKNIQIIEVANPYYVGDIKGLNFKSTSEHPLNQIDFESINSKALMKLQNEQIGLVISDYEMISAKYSYIKNIPLLTIDQQSKFLIGDFPKILNNTSYKDEVERLSLFFPKANQRIAVSFFKVKKDIKFNFKVKIVPPIVNLAINLENEVKNEILVYVSSQIQSTINIKDWIKILENQSNYIFHLFISDTNNIRCRSNINIYQHNDENYLNTFEKCSAIITTAGHSLLSEAMCYKKPVYAIPLNLYEQQINAHKIQEGGFGICSTQLDQTQLDLFLKNIDFYKKRIQDDTKILLKKTNKSIYYIIDSFLEN